MEKKIMLKKFIYLTFLSCFITNASIAADNPNYDATVRYHAPCPSKNYEKCAKENKIIQLKNVDGDSLVSDLKSLIFTEMEKNKKFRPDNQMISCGNRWPEDNEYADICWNNRLEKVSVDLNLKS